MAVSSSTTALVYRSGLDLPQLSSTTPSFCGMAVDQIKQSDDIFTALDQNPSENYDI